MNSLLLNERTNERKREYVSDTADVRMGVVMNVLLSLYKKQRSPGECRSSENIYSCKIKRVFLNTNTRVHAYGRHNAENNVISVFIMCDLRSPSKTTRQINNWKWLNTVRIIMNNLNHAWTDVNGT